MGKLQCLECKEVLESKYRHDFKSCKCPNGAFVDGGTDYLRFGGKELAKIGFWDEEEQKYKPIKISDTTTEDEQ